MEVCYSKTVETPTSAEHSGPQPQIYIEVPKVMGQQYVNLFLSGATLPWRLGNAQSSIVCEVFSRDSG
jgi:hypothetical protein